MEPSAATPAGELSLVSTTILVGCYLICFSQGLFPPRHHQKLRLCPWRHVLSGEQHHEDKLQAVPV